MSPQRRRRRDEHPPAPSRQLHRLSRYFEYALNATALHHAALTVCRFGAPGIPAGTLFTFLLDGETVAVPAGGCVARTYRVGTRVNVAEQIPQGTEVDALTLSPVGTGTVDRAAGIANVVVGIDAATVTFTNRSTTHGAVMVCKVAGTGIRPGTTASFALTGAAPGGTCTSPIVAPAARSVSPRHSRRIPKWTASRWCRRCPPRSVAASRPRPSRGACS